MSRVDSGNIQCTLSLMLLTLCLSFLFTKALKMLRNGEFAPHIVFIAAPSLEFATDNHFDIVSVNTVITCVYSVCGPVFNR